MPDLEISNLPALAEAGVAATDPLAIADISASETKKVTVKDLIEAGVTLIDAASIPAAKVGTLGTNQVATGAIQDGAVTNVKLANSSISLGGISISLGGTDATPAFNLADATGYTTANLSGTISNAQLAGSIANSKLVNSSVSLGGISVSLGGTDTTPAFNLTDATGYKTTELVGTITNAQLAGSIDASKLVSSTVSLGGVSIALGGTDATPAFNLTDATGYPTSSLVGTITNAQLSGSIANSKLVNSSVSFGGISVSLGASDATPAFNLTDATNYPASSLTGTITNAQLAGSIAVAKLASSSVSLGGVSVTLGTADATPAFDLQDATGYPTTALVGTITDAQLAGSIAGAKLVSGSITSTQLGTNSVTDSELANNAVDTSAIQNGAITNDKVETSTSATTGLDGATKIRDASITPAKLNTSNLDRSINVASGNLGINNAITAATRSGITYNAQGLITGTVALAASDLPLATTSAVGGVSVGTGLTVTGAGALSLSNSVTGATVSGITFNNQGQITAATGLVSANLPAATTSAKGAVAITSGGGLTVDGSGGLTTSTSGISAGTFTKLTVNNKGVATAGTTLSASDIPSLDATKITTGSIAAARIGNDSIDGTKLSNTSTAIFQSIAQNGYPTAQFSGQILFDTVSEDAFIWDGNAWQAITTLTKGSLVFGGTFNASTSKMVSTTTSGIAAGLAVGSNLPTPSATTDGLYVVVDVAGTPSAPAPVVSLSPPDYILGVTNSGGSSWNEIDLSQTVAGQVASNITFTPYGQLSATNVQDALQELETEKMGLAGGTVTGQLLFSNTGSIVFEGATVDAYELTLAVADPQSSDKTITFPDITGTLITTADTNTVTSTMVNGSLVNTNLAANAAIAFSKLAALSSAQILVGNGSNVPTAVAVTGDIGINNAGLTSITAGAIVNADVSNSAAITGSKVTTGTTSAVGVLQLTDSAASTSTSTAATPAAVKVAKDAADAAATTANAALPTTGGTLTNNLIIDNGKELRLSESDGDGTNYTGLKAQAQSGDITLTLPAVAPTANQVLKADGSTPTTLTWATDAATDATKMPLAGGTFTGDVTFTGDSTNGLWDKSASAFVANLTGNVTGNVTGNTSGSSGSCTGNAATATALATARTIGGTSFDGSANIAVALAATSTALATARTIGGVSFDGTANITLPGVNASGTQDTSGTAALATSFTVTANNTTDETVYPLFADGATGSQGAETDTGLTYNPSTGLLTSTSFAGNITGNVTGNCSGTSGGFTAGSASNLDSGTVNVARLGSGSSVTTKFLRGDNTWQTISATPEGTAILSTGESGGTKFLREDGDGTCSWQAVPAAAAGSLTGSTLASGVTASSLTSVGTLTGLDIGSSSGGMLNLNNTGGGDVYMAWKRSGTRVGYVGFGSPSNNHIYLRNEINNGSIYLQTRASGTNTTVLTLDSSLNATFAGTVTATTFSGSGASLTDISISSDGQYNTVGGTNAGDSFTGTDATNNTLIGYDSGTAITTGDNNTFLGYKAGDNITTGYSNIAIGYETLSTTSAASAYKNIGIGYQTLKGLTSGNLNVAIGDQSSIALTSASHNVGIGTETFTSLTTGTVNVAIGREAGRQITTGDRNIAIGQEAMGAGSGITTGSYNTAIGNSTLDALTSGQYNIAMGTSAGSAITTGDENILIGKEAGKDITTANTNTVIGRRAGYVITSGDSNLCLGDVAGNTITTGANNTVIGTNAQASSATVDNEITLGSNNVTKFRIPGIDFVLKDNGGTPSVGQVLTADGSGEGYWADGGVSSDSQYNTVGGTNAGDSIASGGTKNTVFGYDAGTAITTGDFNTGVGYEALKATTTGTWNTAFGSESLEANTTGVGNTAVGYQALKAMTTGSSNTAVGYGTLDTNTTGTSNTAVGYWALENSTTGAENVSIGNNSLRHSTTGSNNTAVGTFALYANTTGTQNIAVGQYAGDVTTTGSNNITIGNNADPTGATASNEVTIGNTSITKFRIPGISVEADANGISDSKGNLRSIPERSVSSTNFVAADAGKVVAGTATINIPASTMSAGDAVTIVNRSTSDINVTRGGGVTMYFAADGTDADRVLAGRGMATVWFQSANVAYISGAGLS